MQTDKIVEHYNTLHKQHPFEHVDFWISLKLLLRTTDDCIEILSQLNKTAYSPKTLAQKNCKIRSPLHFAIKCGIKFDIIEFMVTEWVWEPWQILDCDGKTPLHYAAVHTTDVRTVDLLGRWHTEWCLTRDRIGYTPLHYAIISSRKMNIVHALANCNPLAIQTKSARMLLKNNKDVPNARAGATPLHLAILAKSEFRIIEYLMNKFKVAVNIANNNSNLPIHDAIEMKSTNEVISLLTSGKTKDTQMSLLTNNARKKIAVQQALEAGLDLYSLKLLIVRTKSCIYEICANGADAFQTTSLSNMIDFDEASLAMYKKIDMVMYIIKYTVQEEIVDLLLSEFPSDGFIRSEEMKNTLLHFAAATKAPLAIMKKIHNYVPAPQQRACDSNLNSPLHYLLYNRYVPNILDNTIFPQIKMDARFNPQPMDTRKKNAISYLLHESANMDVVEFLVEKWPECVSIRNNNSQTPLDLAVASYCQLDVIKFIHRKDKTLLQQTGYNGNTILHNVCARVSIQHIMQKYNRNTSTGIVLDINKESFFETLCFDSKDRTEAFMWIFSACGSLARKKNIYNQLPVHIAAANGAEYEIMKKLVNKYGKESLESSDSYGITPVQSMLLWKMGALHTNDKLIRHLVQEKLIKPLQVMQYMKNVIWFGQIDTDRLFLCNILSRKKFTNDIIQHILPMISMEDLMNKNTGIWTLLENLKNNILEQEVSSHIRVYISYYSNVLQTIFPILINSREDKNKKAHLEKSYSICSKHFQALSSKFEISDDTFLGIKACLSNILTQIEKLNDKSKMTEIADMNAKHLIAEEEHVKSDPNNTALKKRQNRSNRGLHTKQIVNECTNYLQEHAKNTQQEIENTLQKKYDSLKKLYDELEIQNITLEQQCQQNLLENKTLLLQNKTLLNENVLLHSEQKKSKHQLETTQEQNCKLQLEIKLHESQEHLQHATAEDTAKQKDQAIDNPHELRHVETVITEHECIFCGERAMLCGLGIHTCKKCIDILYL